MQVSTTEQQMEVDVEGVTISDSEKHIRSFPSLGLTNSNSSFRCYSFLVDDNAGFRAKTRNDECRAPSFGD